MQQNKPRRFRKYWAFTDHTCANRNQIYDWKHIDQSHLRQFLSNPTLLPLFSLKAKPHIEPVLYYRLKQWAAQGEDYIIDNKERLEQDMGKKQPVSEEYLSMQILLLEKVDKVNNFYSCLLFLEHHLNNWELLNCKGL